MGRGDARGRGAIRQPARPRSALGPDGLPAQSPRAPKWADVPDDKWNDWRWQLSNRVNELDEVAEILELTEEEKAGAPDKFRVDITPYFISLIDLKDPADPIRQLIPSGEQSAFTGMMEDKPRRGPPFAGPGSGPPLPGPGADADHHPVRQLTAATARGRGSSATHPELQPSRARSPAGLHPPHAQIRDVLISVATA